MFIIGITTVLNAIIFFLETSIFLCVNPGNSKIIEAITLIIHKSFYKWELSLSLVRVGQLHIFSMQF